jgi:hypothetical protein
MSTAAWSVGASSPMTSLGAGPITAGRNSRNYAASTTASRAVTGLGASRGGRTVLNAPRGSRSGCLNSGRCTGTSGPRRRVHEQVLAGLTLPQPAQQFPRMPGRLPPVRDVVTGASDRRCGGTRRRARGDSLGASCPGRTGRAAPGLALHFGHWTERISPRAGLFTGIAAACFCPYCACRESDPGL